MKSLLLKIVFLVPVIFFIDLITMTILGCVNCWLGASNSYYGCTYCTIGKVIFAISALILLAVIFLDVVRILKNRNLAI
jgi:uncharacterized membrane protein